MSTSLDPWGAGNRDLRGTVSLVSGASKADGIGFAACRGLAHAGSRVILTDLVNTNEQREALQARAEEIGGECEAHSLDVTSPDDVSSLMDRIEAESGGVDVLFNNAGTPVGAGDFLEIPDEAWQRSWDINLMGMVRLCRAVIPGMQARGRGSIINNASLAGLGVVSGLSAYCASKFAVVALTKALAAEFGDSGIRSNAICPGMVWTDMGRMEVAHEQAQGESFEVARARLAAEVPQSRWAEPDEIADAVVFLASSSASYINGVALPVAGGLAPGL